MIDWVFVVVNALWIVGLSILLAAWSYLDWLAQETRTPRRALFKRPGWTMPANGGMVLVSLGIAANPDLYWWQRAVWAVCLVWFGWRFVLACLAGRREAREEAARRARAEADAPPRRRRRRSSAEATIGHAPRDDRELT